MHVIKSFLLLSFAESCEEGDKRSGQGGLTYSVFFGEGTSLNLLPRDTDIMFIKTE